MWKCKIYITFLIILTLWGNTLGVSAAEEHFDGGNILQDLYQVKNHQLQEKNAKESELISLCHDIKKDMIQDNSLGIIKMDNAYSYDTYKPTYGGAYIDGDNLVVCVTRDFAEDKIENEK